jgi:hypothetical protein
MLLTATLIALALAVVAPAAAQQSDTVTVTGVVLEQGGGTPIAGALLTVDDRGPRAITDSVGSFRLIAVPSGTRRVTAERFGYRPVEATVTVARGAAPLELRMQPDPVALEGLTVSGTARVAVTGLVRDARTGEPLAAAALWLTRGTDRDAGSGFSDAQGIFRIEDVPAGAYLLGAEKLGYVSRYVSLGALGPTDPVEVDLDPDSAALAGLAVMEQRMRSRVLATGFSTRSFGEELLQRARSRGMRTFLQQDALVNLVPCETARVRNDCIPARGRLVGTAVFIDERVAAGLDELDTYDPSEFYNVEMIECRGRFVIRAYTYAYMQRVSRRAQALLPPCMVPPVP